MRIKKQLNISLILAFNYSKNIKSMCVISDRTDNSDFNVEI
jgi:hypothetical protein